MNNFQQLLNDDAGGFDGCGDRVYKRVTGTLDTFRFLGEVVDIYFPKMVDTLIVMSGGSEEDDPNTDDNSQVHIDLPSGPGGIR